jgi:hypothetical protein
MTTTTTTTGRSLRRRLGFAHDSHSARRKSESLRELWQEWVEDECSMARAGGSGSSPFMPIEDFMKLAEEGMQHCLPSPRLASPRLASPRLPSPPLAFQLLSRNKDKCVAVDALVPAGAIGDYGLYDDEEDGAEDEDALDDPVMKVLY